MKKLFPIAAIVLGGIAFAAIALAQPGSNDQSQPATPATTPAIEPEVAPQEDHMVYISIETTLGTMYLGLNQTKAPISTANFLAYLDEGFYDNTIFHRVIPNFMAQAGGFTDDLKKKKTKDEIKNEWKNGLKNTRGTIAMARLGNRPDSATSQFFINLADNGFLDQPRDGAGYAVFGQVVKGLDVLDKIGAAPTAPKGMQADLPIETIYLKKVSRVSDEQAKELELAGADG